MQGSMKRDRGLDHTLMTWQTEERGEKKGKGRRETKYLIEGLEKTKEKNCKKGKKNENAKK